MSVHEIRRTSMLDVPAMLRTLADEIAQKKIPTVIVIAGYENGMVAIRAYGERSSALMATGWIARAQAVMTEHCDVSDEDNYSWIPDNAG